MAFLRLKEILILCLAISFAAAKPVSSPNYEKRGQVVFLGDSITDWWRNDGKQTWDQFYEPLGAVNTGVAGDVTQQVIDRINGGMIDNLNAYMAVLKIGTNDLARGIGETDVVNNIQRIIQMIQQKNPGARVLLLGILPRGEANLHEKARIVNSRLKDLANNNSVFFLDMEQAFSTGLGQVREELYWGDKLHLSSQGYVVWAQTMENIFNNVLNAAFAAKVVWMGDSLSSQWLSTGRTVWDANYAQIQTLNLAVSGHKSQDTLNLIDGGKIQGLNPKVAVLLVGGNDLQSGAQAPQVIANIERVLEHFKNEFGHARVILLGLLPAGGVPESVIAQGKIINAALAAKHNGDDVHYLDMRDQFANANEEIFKELYQPDGIHLTLQGYNVWHSTMGPLLQQLLKFN